MKSYLKYFAVLFLFGLNGIVASKILLKSYEIFFKDSNNNFIVDMLFYTNEAKNNIFTE